MRFIVKHIDKLGKQEIHSNITEVSQANQTNKKVKKDKAMTNESISEIEALASAMTPEQTTKRIKKDKGLIERIESDKILITEDNKQLLTD